MAVSRHHEGPAGCSNPLKQPFTSRARLFQFGGGWVSVQIRRHSDVPACVLTFYSLLIIISSLSAVVSDGEGLV